MKIERGIETINRVLFNEFVMRVVGQVLFEREDSTFCVFGGVKSEDGKQWRMISLADGSGAEWGSLTEKRWGLKILRHVLSQCERIPTPKAKKRSTDSTTKKGE